MIQERERQPQQDDPPTPGDTPDQENEVDEQSEESFPASDPPAYR